MDENLIPGSDFQKDDNNKKSLNDNEKDDSKNLPVEDSDHNLEPLHEDNDSNSEHDQNSKNSNEVDSNSDPSENNIPIVKGRRKLYRSRYNRIIFGVCGGIGEYFHIDPALIRLLFLLSLLIGIYGILIYLLLALVIRKLPAIEYELTEIQIKKLKKENQKALTGSIIILYGMYELFAKFGIWRISKNWIDDYLIIPIIIFFLLLVLIEYNFNEKIFFLEKKLTLAKNARIYGVCAGLAKYFNVDAAFVRILFVIFTFFSLGIGMLIYVLFAVILPDEKYSGGFHEKQ